MSDRGWQGGGGWRVGAAGTSGGKKGLSESAVRPKGTGLKDCRLIDLHVAAVQTPPT